MASREQRFSAIRCAGHLVPSLSQRFLNCSAQEATIFDHKDFHTTVSTLLLVKRVEGADTRFGVRANTRRVDANHCIFLSAEATNASLVDRDRHRVHGVADVDATSHS